MTEKERLYEALGELIYVVAMADGVVQKEEMEALTSILEGHSWAENIQWSFDYEQNKGHDIEALYQKVIHTCHNYGPSPIYVEFIETMTQIARASNGIEKSEEEIITSFSTDLVSRFKLDLEL